MSDSFVFVPLYETVKAVQFVHTAATISASTEARQSEAARCASEDRARGQWCRWDCAGASLQLQQQPDWLETGARRDDLTGVTDEANSGRGVHSLQQRHSLAAALHSQNDFAASLAWFELISLITINYSTCLLRPLHKWHCHQSTGCQESNHQYIHTVIPMTAVPSSLSFSLFFFFFFFLNVLDWKCSESLHSLVWQARSIRSVHRLFSPARGGFPVDVGEAGKMLRVFVLGVPARDEGRVHVTRGGVAGRMHRWAGVTAVSWRHVWPPGGDRCRV